MTSLLAQDEALVRMMAADVLRYECGFKMVPSPARDANAAACFVSYPLSARGQEAAQREGFFFGFGDETPPGIEGASPIVQTGVARPITISPALLAVQDYERRRRFIAD